MSAKKILLFAVLTLAPLVSTAVAQPAKIVRFKHADRNKDGIVDKKEIHMEKDWEQKQRSKVNTWWEKRADTNGDGVVDNGELSAWKELEKQRIDLNNDGVIDAKEKRLCWRHARSRVNTPLEKKYDKNSNGWLEPDEVKGLLRDRYELVKTHGKATVDTLD
jgi:Ca2+-binding EF-hand superfamily protein